MPRVDSSGRKPQLPARTHWAPIFALLFLAPLIGEYLLGNIPITELWALPFIIPMYGGGALLIRELVRRTHRGWPAILLLGAAYGLIEAGLADLTLFNPPVVEGVVSSATVIPGLGVRALDLLGFVAGHAVWSIGLSIAVAETLFPAQRTAPWLRRRNLAWVALMYVAGCGLVLAEAITRYTPTLLQLGSVAAAVAVCAVAAFFLTPKQRPAEGAERVPRPLVTGAMAVVLASVFVLKPENWFGVGLGILVLAAGAVLCSFWTRQKQWTPQHRFAVMAAGLLTYAWISFVLTALTHNGDERALPWVGNVLFSLLTVWLLRLLAHRSKLVQ